MESGERNGQVGQRHRSVLVRELTQLLVTDPGGCYGDLTAGGGGHLIELAAVLTSKASLFGIDKDPEAVTRVRARLAGLSQGVRIVQGAFGDLLALAPDLGLQSGSVDGMLLDLGLSSFQLDSPQRGFAFRLDGPLDMRFSTGQGRTAAELVNQLSERELRSIFQTYGEEPKAAAIARSIVRARAIKPIETTGMLAQIVRASAPGPHQEKILARIFQALRIVVNDELGQLQAVLPAVLSLLKSGGRLAVMSYHSLEDRMVKQFFASQARPVCSCPPELPVCVCNRVTTMKLITRKAVAAQPDEIADNSRARSAKLRVAEKR